MSIFQNKSNDYYGKRHELVDGGFKSLSSAIIFKTL